MVDHTKLCRVCLGEGARYIFHSSLVNDEKCSVASINFIAEKLRFVLLLPISEQDGLAMWICELCLVQLNLAYKFKRLALESDQKLRQFEAQGSCDAISNAITYHRDHPDSCLDIGPTIKLETEASLYSDDHSDAMVLPKIASVASCSMEEFLADSKSVTAKSCKDKEKESSGMVTLNIDPANPEEDEAFIQSILKTPFLNSVAKPSPRTTDVLCSDEAGDKGKRLPLTAISTKGKPKKATSKRQENKPANHQEPPSAVNKTVLTSLPSDGKVSKTPPSKTDKKMTSLIKSLTIDMVAHKTLPMSNYMESLTIGDQPDIPIAKKVKLRRNSVCASNYYRSGSG